MMSDTVVVLGGAGLVGSFITRILVQYGCDVRVVDRRPPEQQCVFYEVDVTSPFSNTGHIFQGAVAVVFALPRKRRYSRNTLGRWLRFERCLYSLPTCSVQEPFYRALKNASSVSLSSVSTRCFRPSSLFKDAPLQFAWKMATRLRPLSSNT